MRRLIAIVVALVTSIVIMLSLTACASIVLLCYFVPEVAGTMGVLTGFISGIIGAMVGMLIYDKLTE